MIEAPKRATKFAANEQYSVMYKKLFNVDKLNQPLSILTGISAGITEAVIIVPFELVKIRMQDKKNVNYSFILTGGAVQKHFGLYEKDQSSRRIICLLQRT